MIQVLRETHQAPESVRRRMAIAGGFNRFGEPNYRWVWGQSRLDWIGGKWEDRNPSGELIRAVIEARRVPKYALDRWILERWLPPESYGSPDDWRARTLENEDGILIPALGPYPERGDYEHCFTLESPSGDFVQLTSTVAEYIALAIECARHVSPVKRREAINQREEKADRDYDNYAWDVLNSDNKAFDGQPFVSLSQGG